MNQRGPMPPGMRGLRHIHGHRIRFRPLALTVLQRVHPIGHRAWMFSFLPPRVSSQASPHTWPSRCRAEAAAAARRGRRRSSLSKARAWVDGHAPTPQPSQAFGVASRLPRAACSRRSHNLRPSRCDSRKPRAPALTQASTLALRRINGRTAIRRAMPPRRLSSSQAVRLAHRWAVRLGGDRLGSWPSSSISSPLRYSIKLRRGPNIVSGVREGHRFAQHVVHMLDQDHAVGSSARAAGSPADPCDSLWAPRRS